jgi:fucose permease
MATTTTQLEPVEAIELSHQPPKNAVTAPSPQEPPADGNGGISRANMLRLVSAGFSFFVAGVNDGSIGALIPYIIRQHDINTATASTIYAATFLGWLAAALANTHLCQYLDLGALLVLGALLQVVAHALRSWNPPFGLFVVSFLVVSLGQAFQDTHANTFVAQVKGAHRWLAFIHAMYMGGCLVAPFVSTAIASAGGPAQSPWYLFYTFPLGIGVANVALTVYAFRDTVCLKKKGSEEQLPAEGDASRNRDATDLIKSALTNLNVWLVSMFFFFYLGATLTANGWVVEYLVQVRNGDLSQMGYVPAGFNGGCLLGRLLLAEPTHRFGERKMVTIYCVIAVALQLVFWLVPNIIAASVAISFIGFVLGPLFATGISVGSKLFPAKIQSTALSFVFVVAQMGGCAFPVLTGILGSKVGVSTLQPVLIGLLVATTISWLLVPRPKSTDNSELHRE